MKQEKVDEVIKGLRKRASGMQNVAALFFVQAVVALVGSGVLFYLSAPPSDSSPSINYGLAIGFSLFSRLTLVVLSFYLVRLLMSIVSYNLALSNDLYSKADALSLFDPEGSVSLEILTAHLSINHHKFEASKGFSGNDEFKKLTSLLKSTRNEA